jgi:Putative zinc-finger
VTLCDELLEHLEDARDGTMPEHLAAHAATCQECQRALAASLGGETPGPLAGLTAPRPLVARIKAMPRLAAACETAIEHLNAALDGELSDRDRASLLEHMHVCQRCQAVWEAFATLREAGTNTRAGRRLRTALALPPRQHLEIRRRPRLFDLRLATAAVYLLAAISVVLVGNPATLARASSVGVEKAQLYARAAVENRIASLGRQAQQTVVLAEGWLRDHARDAWSYARHLVSSKSENQPAERHVVGSGNGGSS